MSYTMSKSRSSRIKILLTALYCTISSMSLALCHGAFVSSSFTSKRTPHSAFHQMIQQQLRITSDEAGIGIRCPSWRVCQERSMTNNKNPIQKYSRRVINRMPLILIAIASNTAAAFGTNTVNSLATKATISTYTLMFACLLPTLLGYYKSEYGVSYGYGTSMAVSSYIILSSIATQYGLQLLPSSIPPFKPTCMLVALQAYFHNLKSLLPASISAFHAFCLFFYGIRLDLFLAYRETCLPRFREMRERIEERAKKQGSRWKRTPFLLSCAFLYFCMICPVVITSRVCEGLSMSAGLEMGFGRKLDLLTLLEQLLRGFVLLTLSGFLLGALGDLNKSIGKLIQGEDSLVTGGIFRFLRHPNYTGEVIGWVSSCLAGFTAVAWKTVKSGNLGMAIWKNMAPFLILSVMGAVGIVFVLGTATVGLEYRQKEKYGDTEQYKDWIKKSWIGFTMSKQNETRKNSSKGDESIDT